MKGKLTARTLRIILIVLLVLLVLGGYGLFTLGHGYLAEQAKTTSDAATRAKQSAQEQANLAATKIELAKNKQAVERASKIVAESKTYQYQNQVTTDLYQLAAKHGIEIVGITFDATKGAAGGSTAPASSPAPTAPAGSTAPSATSAAPAAVGVKSTNISVALNNPVSYERIINFVYAIEQNLTKMRVEGITLSADQKNPSEVTTGTLALEVYLKNE